MRSACDSRPMLTRMSHSGLSLARAEQGATQDQALEATPAYADAEQLQPL